MPKSTSEEGKCSRCGGKGTVMDYPHANSDFYDEVECPVCKGTGNGLTPSLGTTGKCEVEKKYTIKEVLDSLYFSDKDHDDDEDGFTHLTSTLNGAGTKIRKPYAEAVQKLKKILFNSKGYYDAHHIDIIVRRDGKDLHFEGDFLKRFIE